MLICLTLLMSFNQNVLGVGEAIKNFFFLPFNAVKSLLTESSYSRNKDRTLETASTLHNSSEINYCVNQEGQLVDESQVADLSAILRKTCQCDTWGTCVKEVCSCDKLCPDNFNIFKRPQFTDLAAMSLPENGLAFRNESVGEITMTTGYCWGHATVNAQFNRLAFFEPGIQAPFDLQSSNEDEQNKAIDYYKEIIDQIVSNKATTIPGFKNLQELSKNPALQSYLGDKVAKVWAKNAMSIQGLKVALQAESRPEEEYKRNLAEVKEKLALGVQPTIVFTGMDSPFYTHAVLVSHMDQKQDIGEVFCIRDNNHSDISNHFCDNFLYLRDDGVIAYSALGWGLLGGFDVAHNENADMVAQKESLLGRCLDDKGCK